MDNLFDEPLMGLVIVLTAAITVGGIVLGIVIYFTYFWRNRDD